MQRSLRLILAGVVTVGLTLPALSGVAAPRQPIDPGSSHPHHSRLDATDAASTAKAVAAETTGRNLITNGSSEAGRWTAAGSPAGWSRAGDPSQLTWSRPTAHGGRHSLRIHNTKPAVAFWQQTVSVTPNALYRLSGWIKTQGVQAVSGSLEDVGAHLTFDGSYPPNSAAVVGTQPWTYRTVLVRSDGTGMLTVRARLGGDFGRITGTAWFDDLQLAPVLPSAKNHPRWRILVTAYDRTEVDLPVGNGQTHRAVGRYNRAQRAELDASARNFVTGDIPALTSGNQRPRLTIQHKPLAPVEYDSDYGWLVRSGPVKASPAYDAVIVVFPNVVTDQVTGETRELDGTYYGLTDYVGTGQGYSLVLGNQAVGATNRAVFKHEFGHAILFFYSASGITPQPTVDNHEPDNYVNCRSGRPYLLDQEEGDDAYPVLNGVYYNQASFTHDYYSGTAALATEPTQCLGVTPDSWAMGGPLSMSTRTLVVQANELGVAVHDLVDEGALTARRAATLRQLARHIANELRADRPSRALAAANDFTRSVQRLHRKGHLSGKDARVLVETAALLHGQLTGSGRPT